MLIGALSISVLASLAVPASGQPSLPNVHESDYVTRDFAFSDGETISELRIHYTTFGVPKRNSAGEITNAVLLLSGTGGNGKGWIVPSLANELYGAGQALDASQYFIILPDNLGRGGSSKPSDGLKANFPHYRVADLVRTGYLLVTDGLGIKRLRLVMGSSMGGMQAWLWATTYPDAADAIVPVASMPIAMGGRNWLLRKIAIEAIRHDPDWKGGHYDTSPTSYIYTAAMSSLWTGSALEFQNIAPTINPATSGTTRWSSRRVRTMPTTCFGHSKL